MFIIFAPFEEESALQSLVLEPARMPGYPTTPFVVFFSIWFLGYFNVWAFYFILFESDIVYILKCSVRLAAKT
jgi:hypothetical protein